MPWTKEDVDKHKKGLTDRQKERWKNIANSVLKRCLAKGGSQSECEASAIKQASGVVGNKNFEKVVLDKEKLVFLVNEEHNALEDWEYLIHHIEEENSEEVIHHCFLLDHLGNKYTVEHFLDNNGETKHGLVGLAEDQDVYWSDQEAVEDGQNVPCSDRQLPK